jgi:hypothetical protein
VRPIAVAECKYPEAGVGLTGADGRVVHSIRNGHSNLDLCTGFRAETSRVNAIAS